MVKTEIEDWKQLALQLLAHNTYPTTIHIPSENNDLNTTTTTTKRITNSCCACVCVCFFHALNCRKRTKCARIHKLRYTHRWIYFYCQTIVSYTLLYYISASHICEYGTQTAFFFFFSLVSVLLFRLTRYPLCNFLRDTFFSQKFKKKKKIKTTQVFGKVNYPSLYI